MELQILAIVRVPGSNKELTKTREAASLQRFGYLHSKATAK
jgi:hypothetical protein